MTRTTRTLTEMLVVLATGLGLGLAVNAASADGLDLGRDYFPKSSATAGPGRRPATDSPSAPAGSPGGDGPGQPTDTTGDTAGTGSPTQGTGPETATGGDSGAGEAPLDPAVLQRLASKGLRAVTFSEAVALYDDPMYAYQAYVFIDARDDDHYTDGHIPGAHQFDHFRADRFQERMMQLIPTAMEIVVYCNGGDCEDSESAALFLLGLGADPDHLAVFAGGIAEWRSRGMPVERGALGSGDIVSTEETP